MAFQPHSLINIGKSCSFGQNTVVGPNVNVGNGVKLNNVSIYEGVTLSDDVFCGPSCVFTNVINPRSNIERKDEFKKLMLEKRIGANATIICGNNLGNYCFIGAGATVINDVPDFAITVGTPAKRIGWISMAGARLGNDLICPIDNSKYELDKNNLLSIKK